MHKIVYLTLVCLNMNELDYPNRKIYGPVNKSWRFAADEGVLDIYAISLYNLKARICFLSYNYSKKLQ